jgi:Flp pilus assembly protein TadG
MTEHIANEFKRGPISFVMNCLQVAILLLVLLGAAISFGTFKEQWRTLQKSVAEIKTTMTHGFEASAAEDKRIEMEENLKCESIKNAFTDHTGKAIRW